MSIDPLTGLSNLQLAAVLETAPPPSPAAEYLHDPVGFSDKFINQWELTEGIQRRYLSQLVEHKKVAVYGPHGLGKTSGVATAVVWFAVTRESAGLTWKVATTAPVARQLSKFLWPEIHRLVRRLDWDKLGMERWTKKNHRLLDLAIKGVHGEAFAATSSDPANLEGVHAEQVLFIYDEAKKVSDACFDATAGAFSNAGNARGFEAYALAASTPGDKKGKLYKIASKGTGVEDWHPVPVTIQDCLDAGLIDQGWMEARRREWGETSQVYKNRVLGQFASDDLDSFIPLSWVEAANERWLDLQDAGVIDDLKISGDPRRLGCDPARHGPDSTVVAHYWEGHDCVSHIFSESYTENLADLGARLWHQCFGGSVVVDADGMGSGVPDAARSAGGRSRVFSFFGGQKVANWRDSSGDLSAFNRRSAAWWSVRDRLNPAGGATLALPPDDALTGDLMSPRLVEWPDGIKLEPKERLKARHGRSPDFGDAVVYALWVEKASPAGRGGRSLASAVSAGLGVRG